MIQDKQGQTHLTEEKVEDSLGSSETTQQKAETVTIGNTTFTPEEIEAANKPQRNVILDKIGGSGISGTGDDGNDYRDNERVNQRANEASDSTDSNTGGIAAGGAKGANQS